MVRARRSRGGGNRVSFGSSSGGGATTGDFLYPIVDLGHPMFAASGSLVNSNSGSGALITANKPCALPFFVGATAFTVYQLGWWNGSGVMTDHVDIGIYTSAWAKVVSSGSVARTGVSIQQWADIADTLLTANTKYYLALSGDGTTANQATFLAPSGTTAVTSFIGLLDSATDSFPLPDPLTNMAAASIYTRIPAMFMALRAVA